MFVLHLDMKTKHQTKRNMLTALPVQYAGCGIERSRFERYKYIMVISIWLTTFNADKHSLIGTAANAFNVGVSCVTTHVDSPPRGKFLAQAEKSINETDRTYADQKNYKKDKKAKQEICGEIFL